MIKKINKLSRAKRNKEEKMVNELFEDFNNEAIKQNSRFRIRMEFGYPHLIRKWFIFLSHTSNQIVLIDDFFVFNKEFSKELFEEVKPLLESLKQKFEVDVL